MSEKRLQASQTGRIKEEFGFFQSRSLLSGDPTPSRTIESTEVVGMGNFTITS